MIDPATVERIKNTADIYEVVSDYVQLIRRGANYVGLCPFHNERTPSFSVNRQKNFCYCFSCKKGGSPVNFIMEKEGLSYTQGLTSSRRASPTSSAPSATIARRCISPTNGPCRRWKKT